MIRCFFAAAAMAAFASLSLHDAAWADTVNSKEFTDEWSTSVNPGTPAIRQSQSGVPAGQLRSRSNRQPKIEGTDVSTTDFPGILPPGASYYDYPYCCGIHCSCDPSQ